MVPSIWSLVAVLLAARFEQEQPGRQQPAAWWWFSSLLFKRKAQAAGPFYEGILKFNLPKED